MDTLLKAIAGLKINGTKKEEQEFNSFKKQLLSEIREEERAILKELRNHHPSTLAHNILVARDTVEIATAMGLEQDKITSLRVAALLHDIGKLDIHAAILDLEGYNTMKAVWEKAHPRKPVPTERIIDFITVADVINYKASQASNPSDYIKSFKTWLKSKNLAKFLKKSIREYLNHHQDATRKILGSIGVSAQVIDYAAGHHPSYFGAAKRSRLPKECRIIEIADKFNALIQSEGIRQYFTKKTRTEALSIIAQELKEEFGGAFKPFEKRALYLLMQKHLPPEVKKEVLPNAWKLISLIKQKVVALNTSRNQELIRAAERILGLVTAVLALSHEFGQVLDNATEASLEHYEQELKRLLNLK